MITRMIRYEPFFLKICVIKHKAKSEVGPSPRSSNFDILKARFTRGEKYRQDLVCLET